MKHIKRPLSEAEEFDELDDKIVNDKMKVECICPKCAQKHMANLYWSGRGTPRIYCQLCKSGI